MNSRNGFLYGRGSTDNKGPIIAVACAAADLLSRRALEVDLVFLIEGEGEHGNTGFRDAVKKYKVRLILFRYFDLRIDVQSLIGGIDAILIR
jgi:di- and tripeptidase